MADTTDTTPLCPICECGVVDDLVHIGHVHLGEVAAHGECLPIDVMLDAILSARKTAVDARARVTALKAAVAARDEQLKAAQREPIGYAPLLRHADGAIELFADTPLTRESALARIEYWRPGFPEATGTVVELRETGDR